jgi:hypothetical protein
VSNNPFKSFDIGNIDTGRGGRQLLFRLFTITLDVVVVVDASLQIVCKLVDGLFYTHTQTHRSRLCTAVFNTFRGRNVALLGCVSNQSDSVGDA